MFLSIEVRKCIFGKSVSATLGTQSPAPPVAPKDKSESYVDPHVTHKFLLAFVVQLAHEE